MCTSGNDFRVCCYCVCRCKETCLVEAFNLRAAIEHTRKNYDMATEALSDMPPRKEQELDPVTLHNQARSERVAKFLYHLLWSRVQASVLAK